MQLLDDRAEMVQEKKMWVILREIVVYMIFLWVVLIMAYGSRFVTTLPRLPSD